jgi:hypothetical protein
LTVNFSGVVTVGEPVTVNEKKAERQMFIAAFGGQFPNNKNKINGEPISSLVLRF